MSFNWNDFAANDIDTCWNVLLDGITCVGNRMCPLRDFKFAKERPKWISDDLIELMKNRDKA